MHFVYKFLGLFVFLINMGTRAWEELGAVFWHGGKGHLEKGMCDVTPLLSKLGMWVRRTSMTKVMTAMTM